MSIKRLSYAFRSWLPLLFTGGVALFTLSTPQPTAASSPARSFAGLLYFQKDSARSGGELALDSATATPLLDEIPGYAAGVAQQISLDIQHPIYFKVRAETFPLIINQMNSSGVVAQIAGVNAPLQPEKTGSYDADHDNHDDIALTLHTVNGSAAHLTVHKLPQETIPAAITDATSLTPLKWALLTVVLTIIVTTVVMRLKIKHTRT